MNHTPGSGGQQGRPAGRRSRQAAARPRRVEFTLTDQELTELDAAARAGLARGAYIAQAALATARGGPGQAGAPLREALAELIRSAGLVRRAGVNLNQAVAKLNATGRRDFRPLSGLLRQPLAVLGPRAPDRPVWHCIARAAPTDRLLSDDEWAHIAAEIMHRTGLAPCGQEDDAVRWVAVRHAPDHIHIVATLARQDGGRPRTSNDYYKVRKACRAVEEHYGLRVTAPGDRTAAARPTRAETEKTARRGWQEAPRPGHAADATRLASPRRRPATKQTTRRR